MAAVSRVEQVQAYCQQAGMRPDSPLKLALVTAVEAADAATAAVIAARQPMSDQDRAEMLRVLGAAVKREVWMRERTHMLRTVGAMAIALLITAGGCYVWGRTSASVPVFVAGTDARAACVVAEEQTINGEKLCPVWLNLSQVGAVPAAPAGRK